MTRTLILFAAALSLTTTAVATPSGDRLSDKFVAAEALDPIESATFLKADISFANAMRLLTTVDIPHANASAVRSDGPALRVRTASPAFAAQ